MVPDSQFGLCDVMSLWVSFSDTSTEEDWLLPVLRTDNLSGTHMHLLPEHKPL